MTPFADLLLPLVSYPDVMSSQALHRSVRLCASLGANVCAGTNHVHFPVKSNRLANMLIGLSDLARDEERRSLDQALGLLGQFHDMAGEAGIVSSQVMLRSELYNVADEFAQAARTRDLCVVPFTDRMDAQRGIAEAAIFGSGRPVLVFEASQERDDPGRLARVLVAWDGGRAAARAVADAMPLLAAAHDVQILTVVNEKPSAGAGAGADLQRHLAAHGVRAGVAELDAQGAAIGEVLRRHLAQDARDLLVMGAFGHSRVREFVLGGATQSLLDRPPVPIFFAH
jgi:nucleotide-binding universal stress UspA family protein